MTVSKLQIKNPVLNSPFEEPVRHFLFTDDGITDRVVEKRRLISSFDGTVTPTTLRFLECWTNPRGERID